MTATSEQTISVSKAQKNDAEMSRYIQRANDQREFWLTNLVFSLILFFDIHKIFCTKNTYQIHFCAQQSVYLILYRNKVLSFH